MEDMKKLIEQGKSVLGIELGSTRIKAVLITQNGTVLGKGGYEWENRMIDGVWTYDLDEVWIGIQACYQDLCRRIRMRYGTEILQLSGIGISGMMHGYLPFDREGRQLAPFRTWRNNMTGKAADILTDLFGYNIPQRWSAAHLYQAILNKEEHVTKIAFITTLSGYVHWKLTGRKVVGIGDASGMFPVNSNTKTYNRVMLEQFEHLISDRKFNWTLEEILPQVLVAGEEAGRLTEEGAALLDCTGKLKQGIRLCPPEGDAGTGMVATNSIAPRTGNISAGTSAFAMIVLEKELSRVYRELDLVTTPTGMLAAMAHSNNCSTGINAWAGLFGECLEAFGLNKENQEAGHLYEVLFHKAMEGDLDGGGLMSYCFYSGEHGVGLSEGCPLFIHAPEAKFNLANFMRVQLYTAFGAMKLGMDILFKKEHVKVEKIYGHGGIFKTPGAAQPVLAAALGVPVVVMETAGEGGAWGIALLAAYMDEYRNKRTLENYLECTVFKGWRSVTEEPQPDMEKGYEHFMELYQKGLSTERKAIEDYVHVNF